MLEVLSDFMKVQLSEQFEVTSLEVELSTDVISRKFMLCSS